jgi:hypothetical protein
MKPQMTVTCNFQEVPWEEGTALQRAAHKEFWKSVISRAKEELLSQKDIANQANDGETGN